MFEPVRRDGKLTGYRVNAAERALTWRQLVAFLAGFAAFIFFIMAFGKGSDLDSVRDIGRYGLAAASAVCIAFTVWHLRTINRRDMVPDILAQMVPPEAIIELGKCQLSFVAHGHGSRVEVSGLIQNMTDGPGMLTLRFKSPGTILISEPIIPELNVDVPPAGVVRVHGRFASRDPGARMHKAYLDGKFFVKGKRVRFARRRMLTRRVHPILTVALLFTGHFHGGGGTFLTFTTVDDPAGAPDTDVYWNTEIVWSLDPSMNNSGQNEPVTSLPPA